MVSPASVITSAFLKKQMKIRWAFADPKKVFGNCHLTALDIALCKLRTVVTPSCKGG